MKLERTNDNLNILHDKESITIEEALKFFKSFCDDLKFESGESIEQHEVGNINEALKNIRWIGRTIVRTYNVNKENIDEVASSERLQSIVKELEEVDSSAEEVEKSIEVMNEKEAELNKRLDTLKDEKVRLEELNNDAFKKNEKCNYYEEEIKNYKTIDIPETEKRYNELKEEYLKYVEVYQIKKNQENEISEKVNLKKNEYDDVNERYIQLSQEYEKLKEKEESIKNEIEEKKLLKDLLEKNMMDDSNLIECFKSSLFELQKDEVRLKEERIRIDNYKTEKIKENISLKNEVENLNNLLSEEKDKLDILNNEKKEKEESIKLLKQQKEDIQKTLNELNGTWESTENENKTIQEKIERIREYLENDNLQQLKIKYEEASEEKKKVEKEHNEVTENIVKIINAKELLENKFNILKEEYEKLQSKKNSIEEERKTLDIEFENLKKWHEQACLDGYEEELKNCEKSCQILAEAQHAMIKDLERCDNETDFDAKELQEIFSDELKGISKKLKECQYKYRKSIETIPYIRILK